MQIKYLRVGKNKFLMKNSWCSILNSRIMWHFIFKRFGNALHGLWKVEIWMCPILLGISPLDKIYNTTMAK
jgi:hypothetical protein